MSTTATRTRKPRLTKKQKAVILDSAERGRQLLAAFASETDGRSNEELIIDILTDLQHLLQQDGDKDSESFDSLLDSARINYEAEQNGDD